MNVFFLHSSAVSSNKLDADLGFVGKEHEHLICGVVVVMNKNNQVRTRWSFLAGRNEVKEKFQRKQKL